MSLIEWFLNFYEDARELRPVEGVVRAGEVLFVPKGWWHLALNLEVRHVPDSVHADWQVLSEGGRALFYQGAFQSWCPPCPKPACRPCSVLLGLQTRNPAGCAPRLPTWLQDNTTAVTQNFVSAVNLPHVLRLLRTGSRQLVSGCAPEERADLYHRFVVALEQKHPQVQACRTSWEPAGSCC